MIAQEAKFELLNYNAKGKNYPDNKDYGYALTEYLVKLHDADGEEVMYHITDYYNDSEEIIHTKIWVLEHNVLDIKLIENDSKLGKKILTFISNEHSYRGDVLESMYVKEMDIKIDDYCNREY